MSDQNLERILRDLRPKLHRFCSRMVGSVLDGEDLVQDTLTEAFLHVSSLRDATRLEPWLFRIGAGVSRISTNCKVGGTRRCEVAHSRV